MKHLKINIGKPTKEIEVSAGKYMYLSIWCTTVEEVDRAISAFSKKGYIDSENNLKRLASNFIGRNREVGISISTKAVSKQMYYTLISGAPSHFYVDPTIVHLIKIIK